MLGLNNEHVADFLYNGEAFIMQEELKMFLETAQELQVKGLQGELQGICPKVSEKQNSSYHDTTYEEKNARSNEDIVCLESVLNSFEELPNSFDAIDDT